MVENNNSHNTLKVKLYANRSSSTSRFIDAEINESGDLVISAQDIGAAPLEYLDDSDYEWWVTVKADNKDAVLLALIERVFGGNFSASDDFRDWLKEKGIPSNFFCY